MFTDKIEEQMCLNYSNHLLKKTVQSKKFPTSTQFTTEARFKSFDRIRITSTLIHQSAIWKSRSVSAPIGSDIPAKLLSEVLHIVAFCPLSKAFTLFSIHRWWLDFHTEWKLSERCYAFSVQSIFGTLAHAPPRVSFIVFHQPVNVPSGCTRTPIFLQPDSTD